MRPKKIYVSDDALYTATALGKKLTHPDTNLKNTEYTDLSQLWHDADEPPKSDDDILIKHTDDYTVGWFDEKNSAYHCEEGVVIEHTLRWAYIKDLIPKE